MSEQEIKSLLYKDMQRFKKLQERIEALEKQVLLMHEHLTATTSQVIIIGKSISQLLTNIKDNVNDNTSGSDLSNGKND